MKLLERVRLLQAIQEIADVCIGGHYVYTGGAHGDGYVNYRKLAEAQHRPMLKDATEALFDETIQKANIDLEKPIVVVGPETLGALMINQLRVSAKYKHLIVHTRVLLKTPTKGVFEWYEPPHHIFNKDAQIIWMDDLLNAGSTFESTRNMIAECGGHVHAISVFGDRSNLSSAELGVNHVVSLQQFGLERYDVSKRPCILCEALEPIILRPGHGWKFKEENPNYPGGFTELKAA